MLRTLVTIAAIASLAFPVALSANTKQLAICDVCISGPLVEPDSTIGPYAPVHVIGGAGGNEFCESRIETSGEVVSGLGVWWDKNGIKGILFTFSGGDIDVGSGILVGAHGASSEYVVHLAFLFLSSEVASVSIGDIKFVSNPEDTSVNLAPSYLIRSTMGNPSGSADNVSFTVTGTGKVMQSTTWIQSSPDTFGGSINVEVSSAILGVGMKVTGGFEWTTSDTSSQSTMISDEVTLTLTAGPFSIPPGHGKACQIFAQKGEGSFPYTSRVALNLDDGGNVEYPETGKLLSVQYSKVQALCVDANDPKDWNVDPDNPPPGVSVIGRSLRRPRTLPPPPILRGSLRVALTVATLFYTLAFVSLLAFCITSD
ncbi:MAG: hypothetical protein Q9212_006677 [Teloschistes hypoglaucus]